MMDSGNLFGLDSLCSVEDDAVGDDWEDVVEEGDYDALNEETFGCNAVDEDWEESHEQLSSLTEAEKSGKRAFGLKASNDFFFGNKKKESSSELTAGLSDFFLNDNVPKSSVERPDTKFNLFSSNAHSSFSNHINPAVNNKHISESNVGNIWGMPNNLIPTQQVHQNKGMNYGLGSMLQQNNVQKPLGGLQAGLPSLPAVKTVSQLEDEMKLLHLHKQKSAMEASKLVNHQNDQMMRASKINPQVGLPPGVHSPHINHFTTPPPALPPSAQHQLNLHKMELERQQQQMVLQNMNRGAYINNINDSTEWQKYRLMKVKEVEQAYQRIQQEKRRREESNSINNDHRKWNNQQFNNQNYNHMNRNGPNFHNNHHHQHHHQNNSRDYSSNGQGSGRVRRDSDAEWEEWGRQRQLDEYAGLMTPSEKHWLKNIQHLQLESKDPYVDDFYYTMFQEKKMRRMEKDHLGSLSASQLNRNNQGKEYTPPHLENSLGKLQVASVTAPRKIIDIWVVHLDPEHPTTPLQRDMRRHRHLLLYIEKMYNILMDLEDSERKVHMLPDCPTRDSFLNTSRKLSKKLWQESSNNQHTLIQIMCVRKGKNLLGRLLPWLESCECRCLASSLMKNLALVSKRDQQEGRLEVLWPAVEKSVINGDRDSLISISELIVPHLVSSQKTRLPSLFSNKFGVSVMIALLVRGELLWQELKGNEQWQNFLASVASSIVKLSKIEGSSLPPLLPPIAKTGVLHQSSAHLGRCFKLDPGTIKAAQQLLLRTEGAAFVSHSNNKVVAKQ